MVVGSVLSHTFRDRMYCNASFKFVIIISHTNSLFVATSHSPHTLQRGFRRVVTTGPDRDTYYHELFLRGKHNLHVKMKRLPTTHRKTPMDKNESSPNFYEMSEKSPLPENVWLPQAGVVSHRGTATTTHAAAAGPMGYVGMMGSAAAAGM